MLAEARRIKESLFFHEWTVFHYLPPSHLRSEAVPGEGDSARLEVRREQLVEVLERHRLYAQLEDSLAAVLRAAAADGVGEQDVDDVLMIGGSTLLPGVYPFFEERFGRDRVRAWRPFEAVALGAAALAAQRFVYSDLIAHDYAVVTYDPESHEKRHTVIVPRGTRVPTPPALWKGRLVPTCAHGEPERLFKLVVCEIGRAGDGHRFLWDRGGALQRVEDGSGEDGAIVVPLNEADPTLGVLEPPHSPRDRRPRLEVAFSVDADRWLRATVDDLRTDQRLLDQARVVRLL
jgi:molecular chaperone DnaK (HSP70)